MSNYPPNMPPPPHQFQQPPGAYQHPNYNRGHRNMGGGPPGGRPQQYGGHGRPRGGPSHGAYRHHSQQSSSHHHNPADDIQISSGLASSSSSSLLSKSQATYLRGHSQSHINHATFAHNTQDSSSNPLLFSAGKDKYVKVWNYHAALRKSKSSCIHTLRGHTEAVTKIASHPSKHNTLCSVSHDGSARLWNIDSASNDHLQFNTKERNVDVRYNPRGESFSVLTAQNNLFVFDERKQDTPLHRKSFTAFNSKKADIYEMEYGQNGDYLFMVRSDHLFVVDMNSLNEVATIPITCDPARTFCLKFDPLYRYLAVASTDSILSLLSTEDWSCQRGITHLFDAIRSVAFSHDSKWIAHATGKLKYIDIASVETGAQVLQVSSPEGVTSVDFAPNEYIVSITGSDSSLWLHDLRNNSKLKTED